MRRDEFTETTRYLVTSGSGTEITPSIVSMIVTRELKSDTLFVALRETENPVND